MFRCFSCHREAVLVRGLCTECGREWHQLHEARLGAIKRLNARYLEVTGHEALEDWNAFEHWARTNGGLDWTDVLAES